MRATWVIIMVATLACESSKEKEPTFDELRALRDEVCQCKDLVCVAQKTASLDIALERKNDPLTRAFYLQKARQCEETIGNRSVAKEE
jgi:hypothetical protein